MLAVVVFRLHHLAVQPRGEGELLAGRTWSALTIHGPKAPVATKFCPDESVGVPLPVANQPSL